MTNETTSMRYAFGKNWAEFIEKNFSQSVVDDLREHLAQFIRLDTLKGLTLRRHRFWIRLAFPGSLPDASGPNLQLRLRF